MNFTVRFFICGSALRGQPDHGNLGSARFIGAAKTAPKYRMHAVKNGWHPGIYEVSACGVSLAGELYELTAQQHASLIAGEPPGMYEQTVELADGTFAQAMLYPRSIIESNGYPDISDYGGWAAFKAAADRM